MTTAVLVIVGVLVLLLLGLFCVLAWLIWMNRPIHPDEFTNPSARLLLLDLKDIIDHVTTDTDFVAAVHLVYAKWADVLGDDGSGVRP